MRRQLAIAIFAAALLSACASVKLPAIPPPVDAATSASAPAQPAPTSWYQPFRADGSWEEKRFGIGMLKARYAFTDEKISMKTDNAKTMATGPVLQFGPLSADLLAVYATTSIAFFGFGWGDASLDIGGARIPVSLAGLYEGVRVPITIADFKGPDVQLLLIPGMTMQVFWMNGRNSAGASVDGMMLGGSLNGLGVGVAVGDWLVLEADFVKWGWSYVDLTTLKRPLGVDLTGSVTGFTFGVAPVFHARVVF
jgi:hypothetical protein